MPRGDIRTLENAHNTGLSGCIRRSLRHLPLSVHLPAIDRQPERGNQENAHREHNENDGLSIPATETTGWKFQNTIIP
jgi:hypothetical protein